VERDARLQIAIGAVLRPRDAERSKTQDHVGAPRGAARNGGQVKKELRRNG
jgi:hypothetical protein